MTSVLELKGRHRGACCLLANGPSLNDYDLKAIPVPTIGVNAAWMHPTTYEPRFWPTYHVVAETVHAERHKGPAAKDWHRSGSPCVCPEAYRRMSDEGRLLTVGTAWTYAKNPLGVNFKIRNVMPGDPCVFSQDLTQGAIISLGITGTVSLCAMQIARWLGFTTLYAIGLDLGGRVKFNGRAVGKLDAQRELFKLALPGIKAAGLDVKVIGEDSCARMFDRIKWPW